MICDRLSREEFQTLEMQLSPSPELESWGMDSNPPETEAEISQFKARDASFVGRKSLVY